MKFSNEAIITILEVINQGSFSGAARKLKRVPSAVNMHIANLEAELGFKLFERHKKNVTPSRQTLAILPQLKFAAEQLLQLDRLSAELSLGLEAKLILGIAAGVPYDAWSQSVNTVQERYPNLMLDVRYMPQEELDESLRQQTINLAIGFQPVKLSKDKSFKLVSWETFIAISSESFYEKIKSQYRNDIKDLFRFKQVIVTSLSIPLGESSLEVSNSTLRTNSFEVALELVAQGAGWANIPKTTFSRYKNDLKLIKLNFDNTTNGIDLPIVILWQSDTALGPAAQEFLSAFPSIAG